jgi:hypothetical protein
MIAATAAKMATPRHVFASIVLKAYTPRLCVDIHAYRGCAALDAPPEWRVCCARMTGVNAS